MELINADELRLIYKPSTSLYLYVMRLRSLTHWHVMQIMHKADLQAQYVIVPPK